MSGAMSSGGEQRPVDDVRAAVEQDLSAALGECREQYMHPRRWTVATLLGAPEAPVPEALSDIPAEFYARGELDGNVNGDTQLLTPGVRLWAEKQGLLPYAPLHIRLPEQVDQVDLADRSTIPMPAVAVKPTIANVVAGGTDSRAGAIAALSRGWAQVIPERLVQPDLFSSDVSYGAEPIVASDIQAWNKLAGDAVEESLVPVELEDVPYSNGSHAEEYLSAAPEQAAKLWLVGKTAVKAWFNRVRHIRSAARVEPAAQSPVASKQVPAKEDRPWQPKLLEIRPVEYKGLTDVPEAFIADGMGAEELLGCLTREDRTRIVLDRASQAGWAAFRDAMHSKHSLTPNFTDPVEASILSSGQAAYERFRTSGGSEGFEGFMAGRRASTEFNRAQDATKAAYERGELIIVLDADVARELRDLNIAVQESERYYDALSRHEESNPGIRNQRDAMRGRVAMARNKLLAKITAS